MPAEKIYSLDSEHCSLIEYLHWSNFVMTTGVALISVMITGTRFVTIFMHMQLAARQPSFSMMYINYWAYINYGC